MAQSELTIAGILRKLAAQYEGMVDEREVLEGVLALRPSQAKNPYTYIREKLRFSAPRVGWVRLGDGKLLPLHVALQGLRFRVIPDDDELAQGMVARTRLEPFVSCHVRELRLEDAAGRPLPFHDVRMPLNQELFEFITTSALGLATWLDREGFKPGDSMLLTIRQFEPLTIRIEREPQHAFRVDEVLRQEHQLLDALAECVAQNRGSLISAENCVLPMYACASWRDAYPGRPWQQLVTNDPRLRLVDHVYVAASSLNRPIDVFHNFAEEMTRRQERIDQELLAEVATFQAELLASRRDAANRGLWDGVAPRASTARLTFNMRTGAPERMYPGSIDTLQDHSADIEERLAQGAYDEADWKPDFDPADLDDLDSDDDLDPDDELFDSDEIDDVRAFMERNPDLLEATQRLWAALSTDEAARLQAAETPDQVHQILANRLNKLLFTEPSLFAPLVPSLPMNDSIDGSHQDVAANGAIFFEDEAWDDDLFIEEPWDEEMITREKMVARSSELMDRFFQYQLDQGKRQSTVINHTGDLWIYADFLADYYSRSLDMGDYATLDECMFFFYPRKVLNGSPRAAREMCTSLKQFFAFLRAEGIIANDAFAQAIWRRRDQAARVVELYERIASYSPRFERLLAYLFAPYTA